MDALTFNKILNWAAMSATGGFNIPDADCSGQKRTRLATTTTGHNVKMHLSIKVVGSIAYVSTIFLAAPYPAFADDSHSISCELVSSHNDEESGEERSHSTARALIKYVEKYWGIATLEKPDNVYVSRVDDPSGDDSKLDFHKVQFGSFQAGFYRYPDGTAMPSVLSTTSIKFNLPCGLRIGQPQKKVQTILGTPTEFQRESFIYGTGGDQNGEVIFTFKRGKLSQVMWVYDTH
jgi:hypothetical protein